ncbi:DUF192 domain-containing protein [Desulfococcaceae bacterium HSG7]|nr:DUF192 domain-containing protein [Desulfococcaceae bacterium HSG7]
MKYASSFLSRARGLMLSSKKKVKNGICLALPVKEDTRLQASVTMLFCLQPLEIIFVNSTFQIVEKTILRPWKINYTPEKACKYVIEAEVGAFAALAPGHHVEILK